MRHHTDRRTTGRDTTDRDTTELSPGNPSQGEDAVGTIRGWLRDPGESTGIHLADEGHGWTFRSYRQIADDAMGIASAMRTDYQVRGGDGVCVILPTDFTCAAAFYAVWACGGVFTPIAPPSFADLDEYIVHVAAILRQANPRLVLSAPGLADIVERARGEAGVDAEVMIVDGRTLPTADPDFEFGDPDECALLQFTSGSTGTPRGVRVSWENLATNTRMISELLRWRAGEAMASWLPLYHDMGLVGGFLTTVTKQEDLHLMRPDQFVRDPARWLRAMAVARHTPSPSFALGYVAHRVSAADIADLNLSGWRTLAVGSEPVELADLQSFIDLVAPRGFDIDAFTLAYGLAESTLMVTSSGRGRPVTLLRPRASTLQFGKPVLLSDKREFTSDGRYSGSGWIAGLGRSTPDSVVGIIDADGSALPDGVLGEVIVTGGSVALGYTDSRSGSTAIEAGVLRTGDAGFLIDGELFVLGRMGSSLKVRGRSVFMEDIESKVSAECGLTKGKLAAVARAEVGSQGIALFAEVPPGEWIAKARTVIRGELGPAQTVTVVTGPRGLIHRTSSGKPRRRHMWQLFTDGELPDALVHEADGTASTRPTPTLTAQRVEQLLAAALDSVVVPDDCAVVFEGSLAEGFGNEGSDVDFLVIAAGAEEMPTLPSVLFADGRRLEIRTRSADQLRGQLQTVLEHADTPRVAQLSEDLLNRCQRFLRSTPIRTSMQVDLDSLHAILTHERFAEIVAQWWALRTRAAMRASVAFGMLGCVDEGDGWVLDALGQAAKSWCARHSETYLETKWLPQQFDRIRRGGEANGEIPERYRELTEVGARGRPGTAWSAEANEFVGVLCGGTQGGGAEGWGDPDAVVLARRPDVTTWKVADRIHVIRGGRDVFALSPAAGRAWRQVVFRRPLAGIIANAAGADAPGSDPTSSDPTSSDPEGRGAAVPGPDLRACLAEFWRLGLIGLEWRGSGPIQPAMAMCEPIEPYTPTPYFGDPLVTLTGVARSPSRGAIATLSPLPAERFASSALDLTWANVVAENAREDLMGAVKSGQGDVADVAAHRLIAMTARMILAAWGINPLPPDIAPLATLARLVPDDAAHRSDLIESFEAAMDIRFSALIANGGDVLSALANLDELVEQARKLVGGSDFPTSFDSREQWRRTLEVSYDWLRIGSHLGVKLPLAEAQDLLTTGGVQPHGESVPDNTEGGPR